MTMITYREIGKYKYELVKIYTIKTVIRPPEDIYTQFIVLLRTGALIIHERYAWDGASKPAINTKSNRRASLVHDAFYQLMRMKLIDYALWRQAVDILYYTMCVEDKMGEWRARLEYWAVSSFGEFAALPSHKPEIVIETAP